MSEDFIKSNTESADAELLRTQEMEIVSALAGGSTASISTSSVEVPATARCNAGSMLYEKDGDWMLEKSPDESNKGNPPVPGISPTNKSPEELLEEFVHQFDPALIINDRLASNASASFDGNRAGANLINSEPVKVHYQLTMNTQNTTGETSTESSNKNNSNLHPSNNKK